MAMDGDLPGVLTNQNKRGNCLEIHLAKFISDGGRQGRHNSGEAWITGDQVPQGPEKQ